MKSNALRIKETIHHCHLDSHRLVSLIDLCHQLGWRGWAAQAQAHGL